MTKKQIIKEVAMTIALLAILAIGITLKFALIGAFN